MPETQTWPSANQGGPIPLLSAGFAQMRLAMLSHECYVKHPQKLSPDIVKEFIQAI